MSFSYFNKDVDCTFAYAIHYLIILLHAVVWCVAPVLLNRYMGEQTNRLLFVNICLFTYLKDSYLNRI